LADIDSCKWHATYAPWNHGPFSMGSHTARSSIHSRIAQVKTWYNSISIYSGFVQVGIETACQRKHLPSAPSDR
jgi:hypothetical protein